MVKNKNLNDKTTFVESIETLKSKIKSSGNGEIPDEDMINRFTIQKK